jgi:(2Fe-2S) ferredoxin
MGGRPACAGRGGVELLAALREAVAGRPDLWDIAVTGCECLGPCFDGPNAVVYPDGTWYAGAGPADVPAIADEHLAGGRPVAHLVRTFPDDTDEADEPDPSCDTDRSDDPGADSAGSG